MNKNKIITLSQVIPAKEVEEHRTRAEILKKDMSTIKVTSQDELTKVAGYIGEVKKIQKAIEFTKQNYINPAKQIIDQAKMDFDPIINICLEVEKSLKKIAQDFMDAEDKREKLAKEKEVKKVETGYQKPETAVANMENIPKAVTKAKTENGTLGVSKVKDFKITNESLIPDEYYKPRELDLVKIRKVALAGVVIPGVEVFEKSSMSFRQ
jgi:cytochrome c551/c552